MRLRIVLGGWLPGQASLRLGLRDRGAGLFDVWSRLLIGAALAILLAVAGGGKVRAQDATWLTAPADGNFSNGANWSTGAVPTGTAFFGTSSVTSLSLTAAGGTGIDGWTFNAGAANYAIGIGLGATLSFNSAGIIVSGGSVAVNNDGDIEFNNSSSAGSATINNSTTASVMNFNNGSTAGVATINNSFLLTFNDSSSAGHATINNAFVLQFFGSSAAGSAIINNTAAAADIEFGNSSTAGSATINNNSASILLFRNSSTAGNATIINNNGNAEIFFNDHSTAGNAALVNNAGTIDFSASTGALGDHQLSAGSIAGAGVFDLGANTLTVGGNNQSTTVSGVISDCVTSAGTCSASSATGGALVKIGTGTLTLTGTNTYTGATTISGGTLEVDGSIASSSSVTVNSGGTLSGIGIVDPVATTIMSGGTLAPGNASNPTGTLATTGNLALQSGAIYMVQLTPSAAASTNVSGTATLGGATVNAVFANGSYISKTYTILTASGGISGTFAANVVSTNLPANFKAGLSYDANTAYLDLSLNYAPAPSALNFGGGLSGNQQAVANALTNSFNVNGGIPLVYGALNGAGLTQASGELGASSQQTTFNAMSQFMGVLTDPFMQRSGGAGSTPATSGFAEDDEASAYAAQKRSDAFAMFTKARPAPFVARWSVWAAGFGGSQSTDGNAVTGSSNTTSSVYGSAVGADYLVSPNTIAGFAIAGGGTSFSVNALGSGRSDLFQAGAYVRHTNGPAYVSAALAYGWQDVTTDRVVTAAGIDHLRAEFNANAWSGRVEGGYRFVAPWSGGIGLTPYAAAQFTTFDLPAYAEQLVSGAPAFALSYGAHSPTDARTELGLRSDKSFALDDAVLTLRGRAAWAHDFAPDRSIAATFQALPGASFVVNGAAQAADSALTTASAELKWSSGWSAAATFEGEFSDVTRSYAGKAVVRYAW